MCKMLMSSLLVLLLFSSSDETTKLFLAFDCMALIFFSALPLTLRPPAVATPGLAALIEAPP